MSSPLITCSSLQEELNENFVAPTPGDRTEPLGLIHYLFSPENLSGIQRKIAPGDGKLRSVSLLFQNRLAESIVETAIAKKCTSTNEDGELSQTYQLDETIGVASDTSFDLIHLATSIKDNRLWIAKQIQRRMDVCKRKMASTAVASLDSLKGNFAVGESNVTAGVKTVTTQDANGVLNTGLLEGVSFSCMNAGYIGTPILVGWGEAWQYFKRLNAGCCASDGVDVSKLFASNEIAVLGDRKISDIYPDTTKQGYFFTMEQGAIQPIWWNEFEGPEGINLIDDMNYKQTVLIDPHSGIPFDFIWSNNCGKISIQVKLAYRFIGLPTNLFAASDIFNGITYVNKFRIVNP